MTSLFFRNLFFTVIHPGVVAGLLPYWIEVNHKVLLYTYPLQGYQYAGIFLFFAGLVILFHCIYWFAIEGRGTLSPADPTNTLVIRGLYKHSRNPMYIGVMLLLIGEALFFCSYHLLLYLVLVFFVFNIFIMYVEEPRLQKDFKEAYSEYCQKVSRWL